MSGAPRATEARAAAVAELSLALAELTRDDRRLAQEAVRRVGDLARDAAALWTKDARGEIVLTAVHHVDPVVREHVVRLSADATHSLTRGVLPHVWDAEQPVVLRSEELARWVPQMQPAYQEYVRQRGMVSLVFVPLRVRGTTVGLLGVSRDQLPEHTDDDVAFVQQIGAVVAVALDDSRLLRDLQEQLNEQRRLHDAAHRAALHDPLTGLPNRRLLVERLNELEHGPSGTAALLLVDLDGFKHVNDFYGHGTGDGVLVEVAGRLSEVVSASGHEPASLVRLGGDEFAVLLRDADALMSAEQLAAAFLACLEEPLFAVDGRVQLSASIGISSGPVRAAADLLHQADIAMYRAKRGGSGWAEYQAELDAPATMRLRDVGQLQDAVAGDQLRVVYQPIVPRRSGDRRRRLEALVRWAHPERGLLRPQHFLPLAQSTGQMDALTRQVVRHALADVARWQASGVEVQVSVNVTAEVLAGADLLPHLRGELDRHGLPPTALSLELTESELLVTSAAGTLRALRELGMTVAIDDFGTGYSSLAYLADLPLDRLKLDQSFVRRVHSDPRLATLVSGLVRCAHDLDYSVVAEGVENAAQRDELDRLDVEWQQGFLHSPPLSAEDATRWLASS